TPPTAAAAAAAEPATSAQCFSIGPFPDQAAAKAAAARLGGQAARSNPHQVPGKAAQGYNVVLPPQADRETAQALAQRIGAAGFDDYLVVNSGAQANGIALGRYRSREGAERRQSELRAAGFDAQLQPVGSEGVAQWWLDIAAAAGVAAPALQSGTGAARARSLDCALLR
ncbi:MAG: SPOR domain-containing protein, partial [Pseudoxanthomonas sp.]